MLKRPIYETPDDRERERGVQLVLQRMWGGVWTEMPEHHAYDFVVQMHGRTGLVEIKCRDNPRGQYDTLMIGAEKIAQLLRHAERQGATPVLVIRYTDAIVHTRPCWDDVHGARPGGRRDRGDPRDLELCAHIPSRRFRALDR
jgi:hypothetical protein